MGLKSRKRKRAATSDLDSNTLVEAEHALQVDAVQESAKKKSTIKKRKKSSANDPSLTSSVENSTSSKNAAGPSLRASATVPLGKRAELHEEAGAELPKKKNKIEVAGAELQKKKSKTDATALPKQSPSGSRPKDAKNCSDPEDARQSLTVIIGGLPYNSTEDTLSKSFGKCGKIRKLSLPKDPKSGLARGFAFISFAAREGAQAALKFDGKDYQGRRITARIAVDKPDKAKQKRTGATASNDHERTIFVAGLPHDVKESKLNGYFSQSGDIKNLKLPLSDAGQPKGFAFITYTAHESISNALQLNGEEYEGRTLVVRMAGDAPPKGDQGNGGARHNDQQMGTGKGQGQGKVRDPELTVFVSGFPYSTKEKKLKNLFSKCGEIADLTLPMCSWDETQSRGFAFIRYKECLSIEKALGLDGHDFQGRYLSVKRAGDPASESESQKSHKNQKKDQRKDKNADKRQSKGMDTGPQMTDRERREHGTLVQSTGKKVVFESDDDSE